MSRSSTPVVSLLVMFALAPSVGTQPASDPLVEGFRLVEVASVADAMEQLYGQRVYMTHRMRPLFTTKFAGPAATLRLEKEEHKLNAMPGMVEAIDAVPAGAVFVMAADDADDFGLIGGLMGTTLKQRGVVGAVIGGAIRDVPQLKRLQFPVFSTGIVPSTTINHYKFAGANVPVTCGGVRVNPNDIIAADEDGVVVVPRDKAAAVLKKAQELDQAEHATYPFIEQFKSLKKAVEKFGRL